MPRKKVKVGDLYEVDTFARVIVHVKITQVICDKSYKCVLVRESDLKDLRNASVHIEKGAKPEDVEGYLYEWQIKKSLSRRGKRRRVVRGNRKKEET